MKISPPETANFWILWVNKNNLKKYQRINLEFPTCYLLSKGVERIPSKPELLRSPSSHERESVQVLKMRQDPLWRKDRPVNGSTNRNGELPSVAPFPRPSPGGLSQQYRWVCVSGRLPDNRPASPTVWRLEAHQRSRLGLTGCLVKAHVLVHRPLAVAEAAGGSLGSLHTGTNSITQLFLMTLLPARDPHLLAPSPWGFGVNMLMLRGH